MNERIAMDSPLAGNGRSEKAKWYQEVLSLDPDSRIFLPYARLLAELGRAGEAVDVLKAGLGKHPEFLEARLYLIELLHLACVHDTDPVAHRHSLDLIVGYVYECRTKLLVEL